MGQDERFRRLEFGDPQEAKVSSESPPQPDLVQKNIQNSSVSAWEHFQRGEFEKALRFFGRMVQYNRSIEKGWTGQVNCFIRLKLYDQALTCANQALELFPDNPKLLALKGVSFAGQKDVKRAMEYSDAAVENEKSEEVWLARGETLLCAGAKGYDFCFFKALEEVPQSGLLHFQIGLIYSDYGETAKALYHLNQALNFLKPSAFIWYKIGVIQGALGQEESAQKSYHQALLVEPNFTEAQKALTALDPHIYTTGKLLSKNREISKNYPRRSFSSTTPRLRLLTLINSLSSISLSDPATYSATGAGLLSLIPGAGQFATGNKTTAWKLILSYAITGGLGLFCLFFLNPSWAGLFFATLPFIHAYSVFDAYTETLKKRQGFRPSPQTMAFIFMLAFVFTSCLFYLASNAFQRNVFSVFRFSFAGGQAINAEKVLGFSSGTHLLLSRRAYRDKLPGAGNIILIRSDFGEEYLYPYNNRMLGKVIARPYDAVEVTKLQDSLLVNNQEIFSGGKASIEKEGIFKVPNRYFLVLFINTQDVFELGLIGQYRIEGKIIRVLYPPSQRKRL